MTAESFQFCEVPVGDAIVSLFYASQRARISLTRQVEFLGRSRTVVLRRGGPDGGGIGRSLGLLRDSRGKPKLSRCEADEALEVKGKFALVREANA